MHAETLFLLQALILVGAPVIVWRISWIRAVAPLVVVQIILGIVLGPTILGNYYPRLYNAIFPTHSFEMLGGIALLGLCVLGFLTGLHFDYKVINKKGYSFFVTGLSTLIVPMLLGAGLAAFFYREPYINSGTTVWVHSLGIAIAVGVTALPVLSALLLELKLIDTNLGKRVLGYAAINDVLLWTTVAALTTFNPSGQNDKNSVLVLLMLMMGFLALMLCVVRPFLNYKVKKGHLGPEPSVSQVALVLVGVLVSALGSELIGIHFFIGAFLFGTIIPKHISHHLYSAFEKLTMVVLMPFFFMLIGLKTSFSLDDSNVWLLFICATLVSILGKVAGTALPERFLGKFTLKTAIKSGVLMQTKGLMEIVVLNILLSLGIINGTVFSALILMAIATTLLTKPFILFFSYALNKFGTARKRFS